MMQAYSAPPFNITSGVTTVQGTAGRPIVNGEFIDRNAGEGTPFFSLNARVSRTSASAALQLEALVEGFNLTNHVNVVTRNTNFGPAPIRTARCRPSARSPPSASRGRCSLVSASGTEREPLLQPQPSDVELSNSRVSGGCC